MNHAEALLGNHAGLRPSACPGELEPMGSWPDRVTGRAGLIDRVVTEYRCAVCYARVSIASASADGGPAETLNAYVVPVRRGRDRPAEGPPADPV